MGKHNYSKYEYQAINNHGDLYVRKHAEQNAEEKAERNESKGKDIKVRVDMDITKILKYISITVGFIITLVVLSQFLSNLLKQKDK